MDQHIETELSQRICLLCDIPSLFPPYSSIMHSAHDLRSWFTKWTLAFGGWQSLWTARSTTPNLFVEEHRPITRSAFINGCCIFLRRFVRRERDRHVYTEISGQPDLSDLFSRNLLRNALTRTRVHPRNWFTSEGLSAGSTFVSWRHWSMCEIAL